METIRQGIKVERFLYSILSLKSNSQWLRKSDCLIKTKQIDTFNKD